MSIFNGLVLITKLLSLAPQNSVFSCFTALYVYIPALQVYPIQLFKCIQFARNAGCIREVGCCANDAKETRCWMLVLQQLWMHVLYRRGNVGVYRPWGVECSGHVLLRPGPAQKTHETPDVRGFATDAPRFECQIPFARREFICFQWKYVEQFRLFLSAKDRHILYPVGSLPRLHGATGILNKGRRAMSLGEVLNAPRKCQNTPPTTPIH